ncbi:hypothetical protein DICPUDRAFT_146844 [Dictyostelium purpureum]|uniref:Clu domain-containing protein n=1 Tax=Dictyostelium purpureum TaxID=5786 RepID=F0Z717_DICPU|nr:uncharacterized protein DICPUDRAFT_146844 [Dictyostelium purpureum]EGC40299.1 hypothetical protein DICPUDRAFT_146844 [Dictyostelium purpureum]|eukprot:XP_003283235.1 hypothetical protein DICPUDRAFT_146844 [Dictyostelium purpureum]
MSKSKTSIVPQDRVIRLLIIGENGVGKSSLIQRYYDSIFNLNDPPNFYEYLGAQGIIIAYDLSNKDSFEMVHSKWSFESRKYIPSNAPIIIVGCKSDLARQVPQDRVINFCKNNNFFGIECSALTNENIDLVFLKLIESIVESKAYTLSASSYSISSSSSSSSSSLMATSSSSNSMINNSLNNTSNNTSQPNSLNGNGNNSSITTNSNSLTNTVNNSNNNNSGNSNNLINNNNNSNINNTNNNNNNNNNNNTKEKRQFFFNNKFSLKKSNKNANTSLNSSNSNGNLNSPSLQSTNSNNNPHFFYIGSSRDNLNNNGGNGTGGLGLGFLNHLRDSRDDNLLTSSVNSVSSTSSGNNLLTSSSSSVNNSYNDNFSLNNTVGISNQNNQNNNGNNGINSSNGLDKNNSNNNINNNNNSNNGNNNNNVDKNKKKNKKDKEKDKETKEKDKGLRNSILPSISSSTNNGISNSSIIGLNSSTMNINGNIRNSSNSNDFLLYQPTQPPPKEGSDVTPASTSDNFKQRRLKILSEPFPTQPTQKDPNGRINYYTAISNSLQTSNSSVPSPVLSSSNENNNNVNNQQNLATNHINLNQQVLTHQVHIPTQLQQQDSNQPNSNNFNNLNSLLTNLLSVSGGSPSNSPSLPSTQPNTNKTNNIIPTPLSNETDFSNTYNEAYGLQKEGDETSGNWHRTTLENLPIIVRTNVVKSSRDRETPPPQNSSTFFSSLTILPTLDNNQQQQQQQNNNTFSKAFPSTRDPINRGNSVHLGSTISAPPPITHSNSLNNIGISNHGLVPTQLQQLQEQQEQNEYDIHTFIDQAPPLSRTNTSTSNLGNNVTKTNDTFKTNDPTVQTTTNNNAEPIIFSNVPKAGVSLSSNSNAIFSAADNGSYLQTPYDTESIISGYDRDELNDFDSEEEQKQIQRSQSAFSIHPRTINRGESTFLGNNNNNNNGHFNERNINTNNKNDNSNNTNNNNSNNNSFDPYEIQNKQKSPQQKNNSPTNQRKKSEELDDQSDLNERFQRVVLRFREFPSLDTNLYRLQEICTDLLHISQDFIHTVKTYGRIIIEERYLKEKTIQSRSMGGHLGGDKYIVRNVLFKFSGSSNVYDEWGGAKVGGQELKGCMATLNCPISGLCVPLMALVDFMGFRLIAMSYLPIASIGDKPTIVYGSSDMGKTVHANEKVIPIMKSLSNMLNLKPHLGGTSVPPTLLYSATDIEGHIGTDRRFYLIDFSRTFPPTYPDENVSGGHLFQLFRPEFLKSHPKKLCSDAFSGFIKNDPDRLHHNQEVKEASNRLLTELIPRLSTRLKWMIKESLNTGTLLSGDVHIPEQFHRQGINMRWIGHMLVLMDDRDSCFVLLIEAIARVLKNDLRRRLRSEMKKYNQPLSAPYIDLTTKFLNMVFGVSVLPEYDTNEFWNVTVKNELASKFYIDKIPSVLTHHQYFKNKGKSSTTTTTTTENDQSVENNNNNTDENTSTLNTSDNNIQTNNTLNNNNNNNNINMNNNNNNNNNDKNGNIRKSTPYPLAPSSPTIGKHNEPLPPSNWKLQDILHEKLDDHHGVVPVIGRHLLFIRFRDMTHLKFRKKTIEKVADTTGNLWNPYQPFDTSDLKKIGVRVKHTDLVTNAEGTFFYAKAMTERSIGTAIHLLHKARKFFELALISNPNNKETLQLCAQAWCKILEFSASQGKNMSNVRFSMSDRVVINTDRYFLRAIDADTKGPLILFFYANFLVRCERYEKAEDYFLRSLEADSNNYRCLTAYANFLIERGFPNESSLFLERAKQCKAILVGGLK